jgi:hypothetical protein
MEHPCHEKLHFLYPIAWDSLLSVYGSDGFWNKYKYNTIQYQQKPINPILNIVTSVLDGGKRSASRSSCTIVCPLSTSLGRTNRLCGQTAKKKNIFLLGVEPNSFQ